MLGTFSRKMSPSCLKVGVNNKKSKSSDYLKPLCTFADGIDNWMIHTFICMLVLLGMKPIILDETFLIKKVGQYFFYNSWEEKTYFFSTQHNWLSIFFILSFPRYTRVFEWAHTIYSQNITRPKRKFSDVCT